MRLAIGASGDEVNLCELKNMGLAGAAKGIPSHRLSSSFTERPFCSYDVLGGTDVSL